MYKIQPVIEHIEKVYGLELVPCSIPRNQFQYFKRNFYLFIYDKISKRLFFFLRDKISPIKYLDERPNKVIWFRKRNQDKIIIEIEIKPIKAEDCIYINNRNESGFFKIIGENYMVEIFQQWRVSGTYQDGISFPLNHVNGTEQVDYYFSKVDELKTELRDYKLKRIL